MEGMKKGGIHGGLEGEEYVVYARGVLEGEVVSGELMRRAAGRFMGMLEDEAYVFRRGQVRKVMDFIGGMCHMTGRHAGKPFRLTAWQGFCVAAIYGFYYRGTWRRVVTGVYIEVARKNGKSALGAALSLYHLACDGRDAQGRPGEFGAQVFLAANSKDQVKLSAWPLCSWFAGSLDRKHRWLKAFRDEVRYPSKRGLLKVLAADSTKLDGPNPSMFLLDEYHAARDTGMKDVLESGQTMRENAMGMIITTAGFDRLGVCYEYRKGCIEVLRGERVDDSLFAAIFALDEGDDWKDERNWVKANPNMGVTVLEEKVREQVRRAEVMSSMQVSVQTKTLNIWCGSTTAWIGERYIDGAVVEGGVRAEDFEWCHIGLDLGCTSDLTAWSALFAGEDDVLYFYMKYYLPEACLHDKPRFASLYGDWVRRGWLTVTPGNVTDYDFVLSDLIGFRNRCAVWKVSYDPYNSTQFILKAQEAGFECMPFSQTTGNYNRPTKELERRILGGKAKIDGNGINRHCFQNVDIVSDIHGNIKPSKRNSEKKIDGVMAALNALGIYLSERYVEPGISYSPY
jgi:phage terminase large subunit-like protein